MMRGARADLVPREVAEAWLAYLREELPTVAFKCSTQKQAARLGQRRLPAAASAARALGGSECLGAETLLQLLKNYARSAGRKTAITVGAAPRRARPGHVAVHICSRSEPPCGRCEQCVGTWPVCSVPAVARRPMRAAGTARDWQQYRASSMVRAPDAGAAQVWLACRTWARAR